LPISKDRETCAHLLDFFEHEQNLDREPLPANQLAVLETVFRQIHLQRDERAFKLRALTPEVNAALAIAGERFRMNERAIGSALNGLGLHRRKRTSAGYVMLIDRAERERVHALLRGYGSEPSSSFLPEDFPVDSCEFCRSVPSSRPGANGHEHSQRNGEGRVFGSAGAETPASIHPEALSNQQITGGQGGLDHNPDEHNEHNERENDTDTQLSVPSPGDGAGDPEGER
jgi:hypothetical protein